MSTVVLGTCDSAFAGCHAVLAHVVESGSAGGEHERWSLEWTGCKAPAFSHRAAHRPLAHVEGLSTGKGAVAIAVNTELSGSDVMPRALQILELLQERAPGGHLVIASALRFTPASSHVHDVHVALVVEAADGHAGQFVTFPRLAGNVRIQDSLISMLLMLARAKGVPCTLLAVSSITAESPEAASRALARAVAPAFGKPTDAVVPLDQLQADYTPKKYTDALVETNGFFLYT